MECFPILIFIIVIALVVRANGKTSANGKGQPAAGHRTVARPMPTSTQQSRPQQSYTSQQSRPQQAYASQQSGTQPKPQGTGAKPTQPQVIKKPPVKVQPVQPQEVTSQYQMFGGQKPEKQVRSENTSEFIKEIDDLMVKGYEGTLSFERDFVSEGIEMLNRYTAP